MHISFLSLRTLKNKRLYLLTELVSKSRNFIGQSSLLNDEDKIVKFPPTYIRVPVFILQYVSPSSLLVIKLSVTPPPTLRPLSATKSCSTH